MMKSAQKPRFWVLLTLLFLAGWGISAVLLSELSFSRDHLITEARAAGYAVYWLVAGALLGIPLSLRTVFLLIEKSRPWQAISGIVFVGFPGLFFSVLCLHLCGIVNQWW